MKEVFLTNHRETIFMGSCEDDPQRKIDIPWRDIIYPYLEDKGYEVYYVREWDDEDGRRWIDFGSWSWFFFIVEK